jgi:hypothetical protein
MVVNTDQRPQVAASTAAQALALALLHDLELKARTLGQACDLGPCNLQKSAAAGWALGFSCTVVSTLNPAGRA